MDYAQLIKELGLTELLLRGNFGLEKENIRTDKNGNLALTDHPYIFGDKAKHPYITTDFAESQVEMVTPTFASTKQTLDFMEALHDIVSLELKEEILWPYSLPPKIPCEDGLIREAQFSDPEITEYREYLAYKYGKRKQLLSGVHFNFSFCDKFLTLLYSSNPNNLSYREFKDQVYLKVARYYLKYSWLIIYLTGANNVAHESYVACSNRDKEKFTDDTYLFSGGSFRNGINGYRNLDYFYISYNSLYDYIDDIKQSVASGHIIAAKEYYSQLRLKGTSKGAVLDDLHNNGINYVEVRTLDLNPLTKVGITQDSMDLIHLMLVYGLIAPDFYMSDEEYRLANENQLLAADSDRSEDIMLNYQNGQWSLREWGSLALTRAHDTLLEIGIASEKLEVLLRYKEQLDQNTPSIATQISDGVKEYGYTDFIMNKANSYLENSKQEYYKFVGFQDLELSTQALLKEAIKRGVKFTFLDRGDNFIELSNNGIQEAIKQATKTSLDNYATILAMENKVVTKEFLIRHKVCVPHGEDYQYIDEAMLDYPLLKHKQIVIKPNSTNFGLGISILKHQFTQEEYLKALEIAFSFDTKILVEDFVAGQEYRFFVIGDETVAILHREPANVIGDGISTISELVEMKNQDPLRGEGYVRPLEKIKLDEIEKMFLAAQGLNFESVPNDGEKVYLRENSNISTGGDSIDFTDMIPNSYKRIAIKAAQSVNAKICGVDMIIKDITIPYPENNYAVIELNFNPAIHIHTYPYQGKDRKLAVRILHALKLIEKVN